MSSRLVVFVSSPGDLPGERAAVEQVVTSLAAAAHIRKICALSTARYEGVVPPVLGPSAQEAVDMYLMRPNECEILVCVLGRRMGTPTQVRGGREYGSGTQYELVTANQRIKPRDNPRRPYVLVYRANNPSGEEEKDPEQRAALETFVAEIERGGTKDFPEALKVRRFDDIETFKRMLAGDLNEGVVPILNRRRQLQLRAGVLRASALAAVALLSGLFIQARAWRERDRREQQVAVERVARIEDQVTAVVKTAVENPWQRIEELHRLGCAASGPLLAQLGQQQGSLLADPSAAIVKALGHLTKQESDCGCPALLSVLRTDHITTCFKPSTHRAVLDALKGQRCAGEREVLCRYEPWLRQTASVDPVGLGKAMCVPEVKRVDDLLAAVKSNFSDGGFSCAGL